MATARPYLIANRRAQLSPGGDPGTTASADCGRSVSRCLHYRLRAIAARLPRRRPSTLLTRTARTCLELSELLEESLMHLFPKHPRILTSILAALVLPLALSCAAATADPVRVRGSVVSLDGAKLVVRSKDGKDGPITLKDNYAALAEEKT